MDNKHSQIFHRLIKQNKITSDVIAKFTDIEGFQEKMDFFVGTFKTYECIETCVLYIYDEHNEAFRKSCSSDNAVGNTTWIPELINLNLNKSFRMLIEGEYLFSADKVTQSEKILSQRYNWDSIENLLFIPAKLSNSILGLWIIKLTGLESIDEIDISFFKTIGVLTAQVIRRFHDVTSLKNAYALADKANKIKSAFLANMSQEIRTPVNSIVGFSDLLADPDLTIDQREEFINLITQSARSLVKIFDNIIDASKIDAGQLNLKLEFISWSLLFKEITIESGRYSGNDKVRLTIENPNNCNGLLIKTDSYRIRQVFANIIENAFKYTESGSVTIGYTLNQEQELIVYVKDTGIGINDNIKDSIFEFFNQRDDNYTRQSGSTGLGLALAHRITGLLDGTMWFETKINSGTTFFVKFPKKILKKGESSTTLEAPKSPNLSDKVILIAEDVEINYMLISELLSPTKVRLVWAKNGAEAVQYNESEKPDLILMDLQMPVMNGYEAISAIRMKDTDVPIVTQTAFVMNSEKERSFEAGANDFISKPIKPKELISAILRNLNMA